MGSKDLSLLEPWAHFWFAWVGSGEFLKAYFDNVGAALFLPATSEERHLLLNMYCSKRRSTNCATN